MPKIKLEIANSLWTAQASEIKPRFLDATPAVPTRRKLPAWILEVPRAAQKINAWCSDHTHGKIPKMVEPPLNANRLILLDAIYFKGDWTVPFDKKLTHDLPFTLGNGQTVTASADESRTGDFEYYENDAFQAVRLPYVGPGREHVCFSAEKSLDEFLPEPDHWKIGGNGSNSFTQERHGGVAALQTGKRIQFEKAAGGAGHAAAFTRQANFQPASRTSHYISIGFKQKT